MKRRTLDFVFSLGGIALAALLLVMGVVLKDNANFAKDYVAGQLSEQKINFKPAAALTEEEAKSACLVEYAGQPLATGKQAECYANEFIGLHLKSTADGMTYAEIGVPQTEARNALAAAKASGAANVAELQAKLDGITAQRDTLFKGETLRGLLLTSYGFSVFGVKGDEVATVAFITAALLFLLALAGVFHAVRTPADKLVAVPERAKGVPAPVSVS